MEKLANVVQTALNVPWRVKNLMCGPDSSEILGILRLILEESKQKVIFPLKSLDEIDLDAECNQTTDYGWVFSASQVDLNSSWANAVQRLVNQYIKSGLFEMPDVGRSNSAAAENAQPNFSIHAELVEVIFQENPASSGMGGDWKVSVDDFSADTFALLVVVPPGDFEGGGIKGKYSPNGEEWSYDFGCENPEREFQSHFCAFFLENVEAFIAPLTSGTRALLMYALKWAEDANSSSAGELVKSNEEIVKRTSEVLQGLTLSHLSEGKVAFVEFTGMYSSSQLWNKGVAALNSEDKRIFEVIKAGIGSLNLDGLLCSVETAMLVSLNSRDSSIRFKSGSWMTTDGQPVPARVKPKLDESSLKKLRALDQGEHIFSFRTDEGTVMTYPSVWLLALLSRDEEFKIVARSDPVEAMDTVERTPIEFKAALLKELLGLWSDDEEAFLQVLGMVDVSIKVFKNIAEIAEVNPNAAKELLNHWLVELLAKGLSKKVPDNGCTVDAAEAVGRSLLMITQSLLKCLSLLGGCFGTMEAFINNIPLCMAQLTASLALSVAEKLPVDTPDATRFLETAIERFQKAVHLFLSMSVLPGKWNTALMGFLLMGKLGKTCDMFVMKAMAESRKDDLSFFLLELNNIFSQDPSKKTEWWMKFLAALQHFRAAERPLPIAVHGHARGDEPIIIEVPDVDQPDGSWGESPRRRRRRGMLGPSSYGGDR